ncbi:MULTISPECIES: ABC transporter ATP-binding protein [unclassified Chelatococcus]|uniref:ABC transporter ATP-binding protein n=1 Tax=unclassified Chelatococcus TaxID=2638111 RepID=UPI001BCF6558|nr:ABC transporter ATP-binding protein [Chelatococcus sp.]MBS7743207.1 ABC transporter ATP-binding protein [Chelatococcus sp. HY11]CAH1651180.1 sn-glycerol-3-phosphate import ATP-binding protein UgpC [Hyphomicrobiales bacterium]MBX3541675.1 ABC transporter ATP-binding protein [Chelatococcus sp.]MCO5074433.1 ABC transporter ATP-binding protein [Chelatococcus sp.]CAH1693079.1 sn-glycerol-3-phosphate import ATP-binding protein UgpC [Hyphomicrobiales bacterium]
MSDQTFLRISDLSAGYGSTRVLKGLNLSVRKGEFVALLGSSGCGKTTLLRAIAGFAQPSAGSITVADRDVTRLPPDRRGMALVFQSYALWPHMTVAQNMGYGLKLKGLPRDEIARRVSALEDLLGLSQLGQRKPAALSGGQRQRVALGRALAVDPQILLLDEPLSNLDARIRLKVRHDISALQKRLGITAIHVTHDREEAMVMADRIVIMDGGEIAQQGTPEDVYNRPASAFVAAFMGAENVLSLTGWVNGGRIDIEPGLGHAHTILPHDGRALGDGAIEARFRAEAAELLPADQAASASGEILELAGEVEATSYPGGLWRHAVRVGGQELLVDSAHRHEPGAAVRIRIPADKLFLFNARSGSTPSATRSPHDARTGRALEASKA